MQAFMRAVPIIVEDPLRELIADVGRLGVGSPCNSLRSRFAPSRRARRKPRIASSTFWVGK